MKTEDALKSIAKMLVYERKRRDMSQAQVAELSGLSITTVCIAENDCGSYIAASSAQKLFELYGMNLACDPAHISKRLRVLLSRYRLTQKELARRADIHFRTVNNLALAKVSTRLPTLARLAEALEIDIWDILEI